MKATRLFLPRTDGGDAVIMKGSNYIDKYAKSGSVVLDTAIHAALQAYICYPSTVI
ncbi:MAG: hypothetical protein ACLU4J_06560 [Butyricimonas paravirosa]